MRTHSTITAPVYPGGILPDAKQPPVGWRPQPLAAMQPVVQLYAPLVARYLGTAARADGWCVDV